MAHKENYQNLPLESALEETPQIISLVNVYAEDAKTLGEYVKTFHEISSQLVATHNRLTSLYQDLAKHLKHFTPKKHATEDDTEIKIAHNLKKAANSISEMSTWEHILATQIADGVVYPLSKFIGSELLEIESLSSCYHASSIEVDKAITRYSRIKKRDPQEERHEATEEIYRSRKNFHLMALKYYGRLNELQRAQEGSLLQPILGLLTASRCHHGLGHEFLTYPENENFLGELASAVERSNQNMEKERADTNEMIDSIITQSQFMYYPQPPDELARLPPDTTLISKSGYLNVYKKYMGIVSSWDRLFIFIEGGNLMGSLKNEIAGTLLLELDKSTITHATEVDERLHVFTVVTAKKSVILQALNDRERDEWMVTIRKVSDESGYVKSGDKPHVPPSPTPTLSNTPASFLSEVGHYIAGKFSSTTNQVDSNLGTTVHDIPHNDKTLKDPVTLGMAAAQAVPTDAPIIFDLLAPSESQDTNFSEVNLKDVSLENRINEEKITKSFSVHFLGCMKVNVDAVDSFLVGQSVVFEVIRRVLSARATHNMFSTCHVNLKVTDSGIILQDPTTKDVRLAHRLKDVAYWATHTDNQRLFGYIVRTSPDIVIENPRSRVRTPSRGDDSSIGDVDFACHVFECDNGGREICSCLGTAARRAYSHLLDKKTKEEHKKVETNLLLANIAQLPDADSPPPMTDDGNYVLLQTDNDVIPEPEPAIRRPKTPEKVSDSEA